MSLINVVRDKVEEYGIQIYNDYSIENNEYVFFIEDAVIFVNEKDKSIGVSFHAATKPDKTAKIVLILNEMKIQIHIMDSFVFDKDNKYLSGDKAFELIDIARQEKIIEEFMKNQVYQQILLSSECHEC